MTQTTDIDTTGFPPGYFIILSVASDRLLDVTMDYIEDGAEIGLWPEKEKSLVESQSQPFTFLLCSDSTTWGLSYRQKQAFEILKPIIRLVPSPTFTESWALNIGS